MIPANHPELVNDMVSHILMTKEDQDKITDLCRDPNTNEAICKYAAYLVTDVASHRKAMRGPEESQIVGRVVQRELPINSYHIRHGWSSEDEVKPEDQAYIGMPIPVSFDKNIGMKKQHVPHMVQKNCSVPKKDFKQVCSKDLKVKKLNKRKELYDKYTKIDPDIQAKVRKQTEARAVKNKISKEKYFEPKKYVLEQIASMEKSRRLMVSLDDTTERILQPVMPAMESAVSRIKMETVIAPSPKIPILEEMVELMDRYMTKKAPTVTTHDMSIQTEMPLEAPAARRVEIAQPKVLPQKKPVQSETELKVLISKQSRVIKEPASHPRKVKLVERHYELDKDSFELSELIHHVPSRVFSLPNTIEKRAIEVTVSDDLNAINRDIFTAARGEIVDEHSVDLEKRKMVERVIDNIDVPVFIRRNK